MTEVEVFPVSDVIHIGIGRGRQDMERMHGELNAEGLKYQEPYPYHPHITLAQELKSDEVDELARVARARWAESTIPKTFRVDEVFFVQNTRRKQWLDLGESALGHPESRLVGELVDLLTG
jgi:2'-5' RNA ligase